MVSRDGAGASGVSIVVHDVVLCLLVTMMIISLFETTARLVVITAMLVLSRVLVVSVVAAFVAIVASY
jgi:hypothetical protein